MVDKLESGVAIGLVGAGIFSIHNMYVQHAGDLTDYRTSGKNDAGLRAKLTDADTLTGGTAAIVGVALGIATGRLWPVVLAAIGFLYVSCYYHATLNGPTFPVPTSGGNDNTGWASSDD